VFGEAEAIHHLLGDGQKPWISLPKGQGIKLSIIEDRAARMK